MLEIIWDMPLLAFLLSASTRTEAFETQARSVCTSSPKKKIKAMTERRPGENSYPSSLFPMMRAGCVDPTQEADGGSTNSVLQGKTENFEVKKFSTSKEDEADAQVRDKNFPGESQVRHQMRSDTQNYFSSR